MKSSALIIDSSPTGLASIKSLLAADFETVMAANAAAAVTAVGKRKPDIIVIGATGGGKAGAWVIATFDVLVQMGVSKDVPIVVVSDRPDPSLEYETLEIGAADFVTRREGDNKVVPMRVKLRVKENKTMKGEPVETEKTLTGKRVLVADDVDLNREIIADMLEDSGLILTEAADGNAAVAAFSAEPDGFDAVLMDIFMPDLDGFGAAEAIRGLNVGNAASVPIIAMTAADEPDEINRCYKSGMTAVLAKPMSQDELIRALKKYCC